MMIGRKNQDRKIKHPSRRDVLRGAAAVAAGVAVGPLFVTPGKAQASAVIRVADDGGQTHDARVRYYIEPYQKETGIEIQSFLGQRGLARMKAMVETGNLEFDMTNDVAVPLLSASKDGLLEPLDYKRLDMSRHMVPDWAWEHTVAFQSGTGGIGYNTKVISEDKVPKTWADFWNVEAFPGRRGLMTRANDTMELALMADGVKPSELYPLDIDRAFGSLDKIKKNIDIWVSETPKTIEHLMTGELDYCYTFSGRVAIAQKQNFPVAFNLALPISAPQNFAIMKGAKNYDRCMELIRWWLTNDKAALGFYSEFLGQMPTDKPSFDALPENVKKALPDLTSPLACRLNADYWSDNLKPVTERFQLWQLT